MGDDETAIFWLVWSPTGPTPPRCRHVSEDLARAEAKRLAIAHRGQRFYVLQASSFAEVEPVPVREIELDHLEIPF